MKMGESEGVINGMKAPGQWGGWDPEQGRAGAKQKGPCQLGTGSQGEGLGGTGGWGTWRPERSLGAGGDLLWDGGVTPPSPRRPGAEVREV